MSDDLSTVIAWMARDVVKQMHHPVDTPGHVLVTAFGRAVARLVAKRYGQHTNDCAKSHYETVDGHRLKLYPWEAEKHPCTCELQALLEVQP